MPTTWTTRHSIDCYLHNKLLYIWQDAPMVQSLSLCTATPPCTKDQTKSCGTVNRRFLSEKSFQNHLTLKVKGKIVCQWRQLCRNCSYLVTDDSKRECFKRFCNFCNKKHPSSHFTKWLRWNLASCRTHLVRFLRYGVHTRSWKAWWVFWACTEPHVLSKCFPNVKPWMILVSIVNSVVSVSTRSGKNM